MMIQSEKEIGEVVMSIQRLAQTLTLAGLLVVTSTATAADLARDCDPGAVAAEYDRKADDYQAAAERYRLWARAEDISATEGYGSGWDFAQQAARLETAAEQSRVRAAESRSDSATASGAGCAETPLRPRHAS